MQVQSLLSWAQSSALRQQKSKRSLVWLLREKQDERWRRIAVPQAVCNQANVNAQKIQAYLCVNFLVLLLSLASKVRSFPIINLVVFAMENNNGIGGLGPQSFERRATHHYTAHNNSSYMFDTVLHLNQTMEIGANITNNTLPADMIFGAAHIIKISAYTPLFFISAFLNLRVLWKLWHKKHSTNGLSRLNQLLIHLVLADLSVSSLKLFFYSRKGPNFEVYWVIDTLK